MTTPETNPDLAARTEAHDLLRRLTGSTRRDRVAFTLGYVHALDAMADDLYAGQLDRHLARAHALHDLCDKDFL